MCPTFMLELHMHHTVLFTIALKALVLLMEGIYFNKYANSQHWSSVM